MKKIELLFLIIVTTLVSNAQLSNRVKSNDYNKLFVKHVNLNTGKQDKWEVRSDCTKAPNTKFVNGFDGNISNFENDRNHLKSADFLVKYNQNPPYPESSILYSKNVLENLLSCATLINPKYVLASASEYFSASKSPENIYLESFNFLQNLNNYYFTLATDIYFFTTDTLDYTNFLTLITLDRPLGATLGWMGFGYDDNNFFKENAFYITHLDENENGYEIHKYSAIPDIIYDNSFLFKSQNIMTNGGPFYTPTGIVYGILSHNANSNIGDYYVGTARLTLEKYNIINSIIEAGTPADVDLMPLKVSVQPKKINVLNKLEELSFYLHNYSNATFSGSVTIDIFLSIDELIDKNDEKIISFTINPTMPPLKTYRISPNDKPTIPITLKPGKYYIGAIINTEDSNLSNNSTIKIDCDTLLIENPYATSYISGRIVTSGESSGKGWCLLFRHNKSSLNGLYDIVEVEENLSFEFKNILLGDYILVYVPENSNNYRNISTYYNQTPYWQNATVLELGLKDSIKNLELKRIELPEISGTKSITGYLSKSENKKAQLETDNFFDNVTMILEDKEINTTCGSCCPNNIGMYKFENLTNGTYSILIDKPGFTLIKGAEVTVTDETELISQINFTFYPDSTIDATNITRSTMYLNENISFTFYPNPASDIIVLKTNLTDCIQGMINIINTNGEKIKTSELNGSNTTSMDVKNLPAGIYFIKLTTSKNIYSKKLLKK